MIVCWVLVRSSTLLLTWFQFTSSPTTSSVTMAMQYKALFFFCGRDKEHKLVKHKTFFLLSCSFLTLLFFHHTVGRFYYYSLFFLRSPIKNTQKASLQSEIKLNLNLFLSLSRYMYTRKMLWVVISSLFFIFLMPAPTTTHAGAGIDFRVTTTLTPMMGGEAHTLEEKNTKIPLRKSLKCLREASHSLWNARNEMLFHSKGK